MRKLEILPILAAITGITAISGCGGDFKCGEGTFKKGDECVGYDPDDDTPPITTATGPTGRSREPIPETVTLTTNEPATIYYTTDGTDPTTSSPHEPSPAVVADIEDGSTLKFFAKDPAGNREDFQTIVYDRDIEAPPALDDFALALSSSNATLTWTNPTAPDFAGVLIAKITGNVVGAGPVPGSLYTTGAVLGSNMEAVVTGTGTTNYDDDDLPPQIVRYAAWSYDDLGNYSAVVVRTASFIGSLEASVSVDVVTEVVTFTAQPAHFAWSGTASYDVGGQTLSVDLTVDNDSGHTFSFPKALVTDVSTGTFQDDGTIGATPFRDLGDESLGPAMQANRVFDFTGVLATDVVDFTLTLSSSGAIVAGSHSRGGADATFLIDSSNGTFRASVGALPESRAPAPGLNGNAGNKANSRPGIVSTDRRFLFLGNTHSGRVDILDRTTNSMVGGVAISPSIQSSVVSVVTEQDGSMIALIKEGHPARQGLLKLVRLDEGLNELSRVFVGPGNRSQVQMGTSHGKVCVPTTFDLRIYDARALELLQTVPLALPDDGRICRFSPDGTKVYVTPRSGGSIQSADVATGESRIHLLPFNNRVWGVSVRDDGMVWIGTESDLTLLDPATGLVTPTGFGQAHGVRTINGVHYVIGQGRNQLATVDDTGVEIDSWNMPQELFSHWLEPAP